MNRDELIERVAKLSAGPNEPWTDYAPEVRATFDSIDQAGFVIVPREPTTAMFRTMQRCLVRESDWDALLNAAALQEKIP